MTALPDHGGGLDAAVIRWGGQRADWLDLSTGINPLAYPVAGLQPQDWTGLPDKGAEAALIAAARQFWAVPKGLDIIAAPGASALIALMPLLAPKGAIDIPAPTYNEHAAAFRAAGWQLGGGPSCVLVNPNNPDGRLWQAADLPQQGLCVIDESFGEVSPQSTLLAHAAHPGRVVLKSFGKFWGLAGLRLGFAIGLPQTVAPLRALLGPWSVGGPTLRIGAQALRDTAWADATRARLARDAQRLDAMVGPAIGGCDLFRLYDRGDAAAFQERLGRCHILCRIFPYSDSWVRLGLPGASAEWDRLESALA